MSIPSRVTESSMHHPGVGRSAAQPRTWTEAAGADLQRQAADRPSDSPTGTVTSLQLRGEVRATQQYSRNADDGLGWLGTIQDTLGDASTSVIRVRELTVQALNGANTDESREALAVEIDNIQADPDRPGQHAST